MTGRLVADGDVEGVHGPRPAADVAQAVLDGLRSDGPRAPRRLERCVAQREVGCQRTRVGTARAMRSPVRVSLTGERVEVPAVEEDVDDLVAMAALRTRRASERRSKCGIMTSHRRATTTIAVAMSATVTAS